MNWKSTFSEKKITALKCILIAIACEINMCRIWWDTNVIWKVWKHENAYMNIKKLMKY